MHRLFLFFFVLEGYYKILLITTIVRDKALAYAKELSKYNKNQDIERNILLAYL
jgi:hypothetical protein